MTVCANDPSCTHHIQFSYTGRDGGLWEHRSHRPHSCTWDRSVHDRALEGKNADAKVKAAMEQQVRAKAAAKESSTVASVKSVEIAKEHVRVCKAAAKKCAGKHSPGNGADHSIVQGSAVGLKPQLAARMADHLWDKGKAPTRKDFRTYLRTVLASEPTEDYVRRVADSSYAAHAEVCPCLTP